MGAGRTVTIVAGTGLLVLAALPSQARAAEPGTGIGVHFGTLGLGLDLDADFTRRFGARAGFNRLHVSSDWEEDDLDYEARLQFDSIHALLDWHPFGGKFRFTGGVMRTDHRVKAGADVEPGDEIGDADATEFGRVEAEVEYDELAPYVGVGWQRDFTNSALGLNFDVGLLAQGNPDVEVREVEDTGVSDADIREAEREVEDEWSDYDSYLVLQLSVAYRF